MKKDTLCDMVSYMATDVAIVHQIPFTCDRNDKNAESLSENDDPTLYLQIDGKSQYKNQTSKRPFVTTLEKVFIFY